MNTLTVLCIIAGVCGVAVADVSIINKLLNKNKTKSYSGSDKKKV